MLLEGKNAVIYGAGGLGAGVARTFAREGRGSSSRVVRANRSRRSRPTSPLRADPPRRRCSTSSTRRPSTRPSPTWSRAATWSSRALGSYSRSRAARCARRRPGWATPVPPTRRSRSSCARWRPRRASGRPHRRHPHGRRRRDAHPRADRRGLGPGHGSRGDRRLGGADDDAAPRARTGPRGGYRCVPGLRPCRGRDRDDRQRQLRARPGLTALAGGGVQPGCRRRSPARPPCAILTCEMRRID